MTDTNSNASSPLSIRSKSPTPPPSWNRERFPSLPSPTLTQDSESRSPSKFPDLPLSSMGSDDGPPTKKRKLEKPEEPKKTEHLDMRQDTEFGVNHRADDATQLDRLLKALRNKQKIVVIAGAGISVSAGIPDFRSSTGLFSTLKSQHKLKASGKHLFDASVYKSDDSTSSFHDMVRDLSHMTKDASPTPFHHMLATLAEEGRLLRLYTQNVDGIDTAMPPLETKVPLNPKGPWPRAVQLHGGLGKMVCTKCSALADFDAQLFEGPEPPACPSCTALDKVRTEHAGKRSHGIGRLRPRMVLYNEFNPDEEAIGAVTAADLRARPDAVIVVGTSLKIPGVRRMVREMCWVARGRRDGFTAWINCAPEPPGNDFYGCWDLVVRGDCDEIARLANMPKWDDKDIGDYKEVTAEEVEAAIARRNVKIELSVNPKHQAVDSTQGMVTPTASPRQSSPIPFKDQTPLKQPNLKATAPKTGATKAPKKKAPKKTPAAKFTNTINTTFKATKATTTKSAKGPGRPKKVKDEIPESPEHVMHPSSSDPMRPISSAEVRNNSDASAQLWEESKRAAGCNGIRDNGSPKLENAPISPYEYVHSQRTTISPQSTPRGMEKLIDT